MNFTLVFVVQEQVEFPLDDVHKVHNLIELMVNENHELLLDQPMIKIIKINFKKIFLFCFVSEQKKMNYFNVFFNPNISENNNNKYLTFMC